MYPITYKQIRSILNDSIDLLDIPEYMELYEYYMDEMPYGVMKARTGDPDQWIFDRLHKEFENMTRDYFMKYYN